MDEIISNEDLAAHTIRTMLSSGYDPSHFPEDYDPEEVVEHYDRVGHIKLEDEEGNGIELVRSANGHQVNWHPEKLSRTFVEDAAPTIIRTAGDVNDAQGAARSLTGDLEHSVDNYLEQNSGSVSYNSIEKGLD